MSSYGRGGYEDGIVKAHAKKKAAAAGAPESSMRGKTAATKRKAYDRDHPTPGPPKRRKLSKGEDPNDPMVKYQMAAADEYAQIVEGEKKPEEPYHEPLYYPAGDPNGTPEQRWQDHVSEYFQRLGRAAAPLPNLIADTIIGKMSKGKKRRVAPCAAGDTGSSSGGAPEPVGDVKALDDVDDDVPPWSL